MQTSHENLPPKVSSANGWGASFVLLLSDLASFLAAFLLSYAIRILLTPAIFSEPMLWRPLIGHSYLITLLALVLFAFNGLYPAFGMSGLSESWKAVRSIGLAFLISSVSIFATQSGQELSRFYFLAAWGLSFIIVPTARLAVHKIGSRYAIWRRQAVLVGDSHKMLELLSKLKDSPKLRISPVAFYHTDATPAPRLSARTKGAYMHHISELGQHSGGPDMAVFVGSGDYATDEEIINKLNVIYKHLIFLIDLPSLNSLAIRSFDGFMQPALDVEFHLLNPGIMAVKRTLDVIVGILIFILLLPLFLLISLLIKIDSPGRVVYRQERMGKDGIPFQIYKFRTMFEDAEGMLAELFSEHPDLENEYVEYHKLRVDPRVTRMGNFLRRSSLDELPQIFNILKGDMSLVGPRAYMPSEKPDMGADTEIILRVRPGLTGWWQVMGRHEVSFKERLKLDKFYIINFSLWMDLYIIFKTVWIILTGKGA